MRARGNDMLRHAVRAMGRVIASATLCLAVAGVSAPASAIDREALTGRLIPITGEASRSVDLTVPFALNSADLTEAALQQLNELGAALAGEKLRAYDVGIYGHTDSSGPAAYNLTLSQVRAAAVVRYLVDRFGFEAARFSHEGFGEERLLEGLDPKAPEHRRVEIVVFAPQFEDPEQADTLSFDEDERDADSEDERDADSEDEDTGYQTIQ